MTATVWNSLNLTARSLLHHQAVFFYRWRQFTIKYEFLFLVFMGFKNANRGNKKKTRWIKGMLSLSDFSGRRKVEKSDQITATTSFCYPHQPNKHSHPFRFTRRSQVVPSLINQKVPWPWHFLGELFGVRRTVWATRVCVYTYNNTI